MAFRDNLSTPLFNLVWWHFTDSPYLYESFRPSAHAALSSNRLLPTPAPVSLIHGLDCPVCHASYELSLRTRLCHSGQLPPFTLMDCTMPKESWKGSGPSGDVYPSYMSFVKWKECQIL